MYKGNKIALEDIRNNTICVKTLDGIRRMRYSDDIESELVYVNNILPKDATDKTIKQAQYCRYIDVNVSPKLSFNEM